MVTKFTGSVNDQVFDDVDKFNTYVDKLRSSETPIYHMEYKVETAPENAVCAKQETVERETYTTPKLIERFSPISIARRLERDGLDLDEDSLGDMLDDLYSEFSEVEINDNDRKDIEAQFQRDIDFLDELAFVGRESIDNKDFEHNQYESTVKYTMERLRSLRDKVIAEIDKEIDAVDNEYLQRTMEYQAECNKLQERAEKDSLLADYGRKCNRTIIAKLQPQAGRCLER